MTSITADSPFTLGKKAYRAIPHRLRDIIAPFAYYLYDLLNILRPQMWSVTGVMPGSQVSISVCLYSTTAQFRDYLCPTIFGPAFRARYLGRTWLWNMQKAPKAASDAALVFSDLDAPYLKFLRAERGMLIPSWIDGEAKLPRGPEKRRSSAARTALRKIRQHSLEFEITHDQACLDDFYNNMYVPYITLRYGKSAYVEPKERVQKYFNKGELLLMKNGESIGRDDLLRGFPLLYGAIGVRDGNWEFVRNGAIVACYEFTFRRAEEKGCHTVNLSRARPFLNDGLLRFKKSWSFTISGAVSHKFLLRVVSDSHATRTFLENTPLIFEHCGELKGAVFVNGETPLTLEKLREMGKEYLYSGMSALIVLQLSPRTMTGESGFAPDLPTELSANPAAGLSDTHRWKQLPRAEWMDLIKGLGLAGIEYAIAIYPTN